MSISRRDFIHHSAVAGMTLAAGAAAVPAGASAPQRRTIGIQFPAHSFYAEGIEHVLDTVIRTARCNAVFAYPEFRPDFLDADRAAVVDHGVKAERYRKRIVPPYDAAVFRRRKVPVPTLGDEPPDEKRDLYADLAQPCRERGMALFARMNAPRTHPDPRTNRAIFTGVGTNGEILPHPCIHNPDWNRYAFALVEELFTRCPFLAGLNYLQEWSGPLQSVLSPRSQGHNAHMVCFCPHCQAAAKRNGIDAGRARAGFAKLQQLGAASVAGEEAPTKGWFISYWKTLLEYPEILAWEKQWWDALHAHRAELYRVGKSVDATKNIGWHIHHGILMSFAIRVGMDYERMVPYSDHIKPVIYPGCSGGRLRGHWFNGLFQGLLKDLPPETALNFVYGIMGLDRKRMPTVEQFQANGYLPFGPQYVTMETERAVQAVAGRVPIWAGVGFNVANDPDTPEQVYAWTKAALDAGADGLLLAREYHEMTVENLRAAGRAVQDA